MDLSLEDDPANSAVTNGAMSDEDKDSVVQVLCDKAIPTSALPGQPNDTCNDPAKKGKGSLAQVEGFL